MVGNRNCSNMTCKTEKKLDTRNNTILITLSCRGKCWGSVNVSSTRPLRISEAVCVVRYNEDFWPKTWSSTKSVPFSLTRSSPTTRSISYRMLLGCPRWDRLIQIFLNKMVIWWVLDIHLWPLQQMSNFPMETHNLLQTPESKDEITGGHCHFFNFQGFIHITWVPESQTINKEYYLEILDRFRKRVRRKRPQQWRSGGWQFHQDNACHWWPNGWPNREMKLV